MKILFLSFTCEDIGVAMVTNMISQLQESFPLRRAAGSGAAIIENGCPVAIFNYSFPLFIIASTFHFSTFQAEQKYV